MEVDITKDIVQDNCLVCHCVLPKSKLKLQHIKSKNTVGYVCPQCIKTEETTGPDNYMPDGDITI